VYRVRIDSFRYHRAEMILFRFGLGLVFLMTAMWRIPVSHAATGHLLVDCESGHILLSKNPEEARPIASLTKIAAVLVALEWAEATGTPLSTPVPIPAKALSGGANPLGLRAGDSVPLEAAFFAAMMASDNTSTYAFAEWIGARMGSSEKTAAGVERFVESMNGLADRLGMEKTRFVTPHGLEGTDGRSGVSTAVDVARLALAALDHSGLLRYASEVSREVVLLRAGKPLSATLVNTNELTGSRGIDGLKTGTTRQAGPCLVVTATRDLPSGGTTRSRRLVVVLLNSEDRFREAVLLLNEGWTACESWLAAGGEIGNQCLRKPGK